MAASLPVARFVCLIFPISYDLRAAPPENMVTACPPPSSESGIHLPPPPKVWWAASLTYSSSPSPFVLLTAWLETVAQRTHTQASESLDPGLRGPFHVEA